MGKFADKCKDIWDKHGVTITTCTIAGLGCITCGVIGYLAGSVRNPKVEVQYVCDGDGKILMSTIKNSTPYPLSTQFDDMPTRAISPTETHIGITDVGQNMLDATPEF